MTLMEKTTGRRGFLKGAAIAGAGLVIGFRLEPRGIAGQALAGEGSTRNAELIQRSLHWDYARRRSRCECNNKQ